MRDCRAIPENLLNELKDNGGFSEFLKFVKKHEDKLAICFRGNSSPKYVGIYYKNHYVWKLSITQNKELKVTISFNHARYTEEWREILKSLYDNYNFRIVCPSDKLKDSYDISDNFFTEDNKLKLEGLIKAFEKGLKCQDGYLTVTQKKYNYDFVEGTFELLEKIIDDHFNTELTKDEFKNNPNAIHPEKLEKKRQHEIFLKNQNSNNGLFIYDLEFTQPNAKKIGLEKNQPDMLAIRFENNKPKTLVLIEVKSTHTAMNDKKSGLKEHISKMEEYIGSNEIIKNRKEEAFKIIKQYNNLNLRSAPVLDFESIKDIPIEIAFILTDKAIDEYEKNKSLYKTDGFEETNDSYEEADYKVKYISNIKSIT